MVSMRLSGIHRRDVLVYWDHMKTEKGYVGARKSSYSKEEKQNLVNLVIVACGR